MFLITNYMPIDLQNNKDERMSQIVNIALTKDLRKCSFFVYIYFYVFKFTKNCKVSIPSAYCIREGFCKQPNGRFWCPTIP